MHTQGKWEVIEEDNGVIYIASDCANSGDICDLYHNIHGDMVYQKGNAQENARRIAACVNACEGLETIALESGLLKSLLDQVDVLTAKTGLRD